MELRAYWSIILRRIWVIALVVVIVSLYSGYQYYKIRKTPGALHAYQSNVTLLIGLQASSKFTDYSNYSNYVSVSESIADGFDNGPTLTSPQFDRQVYNQVNADMAQIHHKFGANPDLGDLTNPGVAIGAIGSSVTASRSHSLVTVSVSWNTPAGAWAIANAIGEVTATHINDYNSDVITGNLTRSTDKPTIAANVVIAATDASTIPGSQANKPTLLLVLVLVALIIGIALAFLIEYLDDRIRKSDDVVQLLQLPIYGEVPRTPAAGNSKLRSAA